MPVPVDSTPFTGNWRGLLQRVRVTDHPQLHAERALNVELYGNVLAKRRGTQRLSTTQLGNGTSRRVHALHQAKWRVGTGTDEILAAAGSLLQTVADPPSADHVSLGDLPTGTLARVVPGDVVIAQLDNKVFLVDGVNLDLKYLYESGVPKVRKFGIAAPLTAPTLSAAVGGGLLNGIVNYQLTYVNSRTQAESEPGPVSASSAVLVNQKQPLTALAVSTDPQVDKKRLYRTLAGGAVRLFDVELPNAQTTYNGTGGEAPAGPDNAADATLGIEVEEFLNDPPPGPMRFVLPWPQAGRMIGVSESVPNLVWYTDLELGRLKPESWPGDNLLFVGNIDDGDEFVGGYALLDSVILFKRRSMWRIRGVPPAPEIHAISYDPQRTSVGGLGPHCAVQLDDDLAVPALDGLYSLSRFIADAFSGGFQANRLSRAIDELWATRNPAVVRKSHGVFHRQRRQLRFWMADGSNTEPQQCLVFQLDVGAEQAEPGGWTLWQPLTPAGLPLQTTASLVVQTASGDQVYIGTADGYVLAMDQGAEDSWSGTTPGNGAPYVFDWTAVPYTPAGPDVPARGRYLHVVVEPITVANLVVTVRTDLVTDWPSSAIAVAPSDAFVLDTSHLDVDVLGGRQLFSRRVMLLNRGIDHAVSIRNAEKGTLFNIHRWTYGWQPLGWKSHGDVVLGGVLETMTAGDGVGGGGGTTGGTTQFRDYIAPAGAKPGTVFVLPELPQVGSVHPFVNNAEMFRVGADPGLNQCLVAGATITFGFTIQPGDDLWVHYRLP